MTLCEAVTCIIQQVLITSSTARNQNQSPLLRLPGELRNRIYNYVFNDHSTIILGGCGHPPFIVGLTPSPYEYRHQLPWPALRHVCRVTHAETKLLCYSLTTFRSEQIGKLCVWYNGLAREQQESVRRVQMRCYRSKTIVGRLERIRDLPNNQIEEVVVRSATIWDARSAEDKEAAKKFADEQGWRIGFTQ